MARVAPISYAPMSAVPPCGRVMFKKSVLANVRLFPLSMAGLVAERLKLAVADWLKISASDVINCGFCAVIFDAPV